jgi:uncharacterized protein YjbI with pentapeptide repeats
MANEAHLEKLKEGVEAWNKWREKNPEIKPELDGANLSAANLSGIDLNRAYLARAILEGADLSGANLSRVSFGEAKLRDTNLCQANLYGSDFRYAEVSRANLSAADLQKTYLFRADLHEANLYRADLYQAKLNEAILRDVGLRNANLREANLFRVDISGADLREACLELANLRRTQALATNFTAAKFTGACLEKWHIDSTTKLDNVSCDYVYLLYPDKELCPHSGKFAPGEFTKLFQEARDIVDLIFRNGVEWDAFAFSYKKLLIENEDLHFDIKTIDNRHGVLVVTVQGIPEAYQARWKSEFWQSYEPALQALEAKYQAELRAKEGQIVLYEIMRSQQERTINQHEKTINQQAGVIDQLIKPRDNPVLRDINIHASQNSSTTTKTTTQSVMSEAPKYDMRGSNFPGGFAETNYGKMVETQYNNMSQDLPKAAAQIQQLLAQLQTQGYTPEDAKQRVASDLARKAQSNPTVKEKLMKLLQYVREAAANGLIGEATVEVIKLALQAVGVPLP